MRIAGFSSLFWGTAVFPYPATNVLKILRSLGKQRKTQTSSLVSGSQRRQDLPHPWKTVISDHGLSLFYWEKLNRGVSKPGCFPLFSGKVQIVSQTLSGLFLVGALNRPRKRKRTNRENPRTIPEQIGKIPENRESPKKDQKGQKRKDKSRSGNPPFETPPFSGPWF